MGKKTKTSSIQLARIAREVTGQGDNSLKIDSHTLDTCTVSKTDDSENAINTSTDRNVIDISDDRDIVRNVPRGKPKSNRGWKTTRTER